MNSKSCAFLSGVALAVMCGTVSAQVDRKCDDNNGASPYVCVNWGLGTVPIEGTHFEFDFATDPDKPGVTLFTGNTIWFVWSQKSKTDTRAADLGDVLIDPSSVEENFHVIIANRDTGTTGAFDVSSLVLAAPDWSGHSRITGIVSGNINGDLTVVEDAGGDGGDVDAIFVVNGNVTGNFTIPHAAKLSIKGTVGDTGGSRHTVLIKDIVGSNFEITELNDTHIIITDTVEDGALSLLLNAVNDSQITVKTLGSDGRLEIGKYAVPGARTADVTVWVQSDIPIGAEVDARNVRWIRGGLTVGNFGSNGDVDGVIRIYESDITMGMRDIGGTVDITTDLGGLVNVFGSIESMGSINVGYDLAADINIAGDLNGGIEVAGDAAAPFGIFVGGRMMNGHIGIGGVIEGDITIEEGTGSRSSISTSRGLSGTITVNASRGNFSADGDISIGLRSSSFALAPLIFDGCIQVLGDLNGVIASEGCLSSDVGIEIMGAINGALSLSQFGCYPTYTYGRCS